MREAVFFGRDPETFLEEAGIRVGRATSVGDFAMFKRLQFVNYLNDPNRSPRLPGFFELLFDAENPMRRHEYAEILIARKGPEAVATMAVAEDERLNERYNKRIGIFGFLEAADLDAIPILVKAAENRFRERGVDEIRGPINLSMEYNAGFLLYPHDKPAPIFVNYTRKEYPGIIESLGYEKLVDLVGLDIDLSRIPEGAFEKPRRVLESGEYRFEHVRKKDRDRYLDIILEVTLDAFTEHRAFAKKDAADLKYVFGPFKDLIDEKLVRIAFHGDEPVGYTVKLPDIAHAFRALGERLMRPTLGFLDLLRIARKARKTDRAKGLASGVKKAFQRRGIGSALDYLCIQEMRRRKYKTYNYSRVVEDNAASIGKARRRGGEITERRRVYRKILRRFFTLRYA